MSNEKATLAELTYLIDKPELVNYLPPVLYKYRDWDNSFHKSILTQSELYVPNASALNDPFDSSISINYKTKLPEYKKMRSLILKQLKKGNPKASRNELKTFIEKYNSPQILKGLYSHYEKVRKDELLSYQQNKVGVVSLSSETKNILLWSHYANGHRGFAVGFNTKVMTSFLGNLLLKSFLTKVLYSDEYPILNYINDLLQETDDQLLFRTTITAMATKSISWEYEKEYRLLIFELFNSTITFPSDMVQEILLGFQMNSSTKNEIIKLCKKKFPNVDIYIAKRHATKFDINFDKLDELNSPI